jgi:hypothetical protein
MSQDAAAWRGHSVVAVLADVLRRHRSPSTVARGAAEILEMVDVHPAIMIIIV